MFNGILTGIIFVPLATALVILLAWVGRWATTRSMASSPGFDTFTRYLSLAGTTVAAILTFVVWAGFDSSLAELQFRDHAVWIRAFNVEYHVGIDGVSIALVVLTGLIAIFACVAAFPHKYADEKHFSRRMTPGYHVMFLILQTGMYGTFLAQDVFLFFVFWEVMLLPMYFLIGIWGGPRKEYAAIKFFLYTLAGSALMLIALIAMYYGTGTIAEAHGLTYLLADGTQVSNTFSFLYWKEIGAAGLWSGLPAVLGVHFHLLVWLGLFIGFAIKVPIFPFHTWLPDAHVEAPTPISVILAGILLKTGGYGLFRFNLGMLPDAMAHFSGVGEGSIPLVPLIGAISIVYAAMVCLAQRDLKKLIAYSSVSHMGFVLLGLAALNPEGVAGAMFVMIAHGVISPMLFLVVGVIYDRAHHRQIEGFGGIASTVPEYTGLTGLAFFASLGLPGLAGFIGEFSVFLGAFPVHPIYVIVSVTAVIITAAYYLWAMQRVFLGKLNEKYKELADVGWLERVSLYPLAVVTIVLGFYPAPVFELTNIGLLHLLSTFLPGQ
jgi:NADH-quinone oxidoreductase subunit M